MSEIQVAERPHMPDSAIAWLDAQLRRTTRYLEFGSGGSTRMAAAIGVPRIVSVESDAAFAEAVRRAVSGSPCDIAVIHADIGPVKAWGSPIDVSMRPHWWRYPNLGWEAYDGGPGPDLVLIDGRFRPACFLLTLLKAAPGTPVLFDDYPHRPHYKLVERFAEPDEILGRSAVFTVPARIDRAEVTKELEAAYLRPA